MLRSWNTAQQLLVIDRKRGIVERHGIKTHAFVLATLNLFFCGYMDRYLKTDLGEHYLSLFLFIESSAMILIAITAFARGGSEIIRKSMVFPTTSSGRLMFVAWGNIRRPASVALWLTTAIFMIVFYSRQWTVASAAVCLFLLMVLNVNLLTGVICLFLTKSSRPMMGFAVVTLICIFGIALGSLIFHQNMLVDSIPIIAFTVKGISAMKAFVMKECVFYTALLGVSVFVVFMIGRKII